MSTLLDRLPANQRQALEQAARERGALRPMCEMLDLNFHSIRGALSRSGFYVEEDTSALVTVPQPIRAWDAKSIQLSLEGQRLYCADLHIPSHSVKMLDRLVRVAKSRQVRTLIVGGDVADFPTASKWPKIVPSVGVEQTLDKVGEVLCFLAETFDEIYVVTGNHDQRLCKAVGEPLTFERVLWSAIAGRRFDAKLVASDHTFFYIGDEGDGGLETGIVGGHPTFFSQIAAKTLSEVAMLKHRHVLGSHNHIQGLLWSKCGRYWACDPGAMCEAENTPYHQMGDGISKFPAWKQGMVLLDGNLPTLLADGWTDWQDYGAN